jgi:erythromycin esterase-like protein
VRRHGFHLVIFERGVAEMDAYDRYITGQLPAVSIDERLYPWLTEEVRDLLVWLREWNRAGGSVRLAGMDLYNRDGVRIVLDVLDDLGVAPPPLWREIADEVRRPFDAATWYTATLARWDAAEPPHLATDTPIHRWVALLTASFRQWLVYTPVNASMLLVTQGEARDG